MVVSNTTPDALLMGRDERGFFIVVRGEVRAQQCFPLRESLLEPLAEEAGVPAVFADLSACRYMDSTFIGVLVAADKRLRKGSGGRLHVTCPSPESRDILAQVGLLGYFPVEENTLPLPQDMRQVVPVTKPGADFLLQAHKALMETSDDARKKFELLKDVLEERLKSHRPSKENPEE
jgi:anti-anti-sigma factor